MEESSYTFEDIEQFIIDYSNSQAIKPEDWMISVPLVGKKIYEKATLEEHKRIVFEQAYIKAKTGSYEEKNEFIKQMTPILDEFYSKNKKKKIIM